MSSILIIGAASLDTLHLQDKKYETIGGAALYTALAAAAAGAHATLLAPKPAPMPEILRAAEKHVNWLGPTCTPDQLSRLEIAHHGDGKATLLDASWGATAELSAVDIPLDLSRYECVHIAALPSAKHQLDILRGCRQRQARLISCGTYAKLVYGESEDVRSLFAESDFCFMNENEANGLWGSVEQVVGTLDQTIFVTLDQDGAIAIQADEPLAITGMPVEEVDPTGAGDTFCGTTLAMLAKGKSLVESATRGCQQAALTVQTIGPDALL